jgi:predicted pyridoxine 5'-phosphate oxidase superfamily flavin-nucleotide-binding protein
MSHETRRSPRHIDRGWAHEGSPFHAGEQRVQSLIGVREQVERMGRNMIREDMPDQHRALFEALPMLVVGSTDSAGRLWASFLAGEPGFVRSPTAKLLTVSAAPLQGDPLRENVRVGAALGLLGIQLETRRRNRANGRVIAQDERAFTVQVEQSFGNCKQYIQAREPTFDPTLLGSAGAVAVEGARLSARAASLLTRTDTFFIATASAAAASGKAGEGVDVSHRGGRPGFVRVTEGVHGSVLTVPDFTGNFIFNTLGNLQVNPRAGIVCADFESGDVLMITGSTQVIWEGEAVAAFPGAERLLSFELESGFFLEHSLPLRAASVEPSPYLADTGTWAEVAIR